MAEAKTAFIGGSGLYRMPGLGDAEELRVTTPFGAPSDTIFVGVLEGKKVAFLPRHGRGHTLSPTQIPARANIYALKTLGVERIVSMSAVGSLREGVRPLDLMVPDQLIDRTRSRDSTFFTDGIAAHVGFADPFCPALSGVLAGVARRHATTHVGGTYVVMEGPQFSTRAESELYRSWGASVIGMTALPEAKLAREAEICYATLALVTDYDCWRESDEDVSVELVIANMNKNVAVSQRVIAALMPEIPSGRECACGSALASAIITSPEHISGETRTRLSAITGKYMKAPSGSVM
jgi:5'-methylthioadenosine phosphorylase